MPYHLRSSELGSGSGGIKKPDASLFATAKEIIDKYTDLSALSAKDEVLPVISNQKMNRRCVKDLATWL